jgi:hypothetical protein
MSKKVMQRTFWMIFLVFAAEWSKITFLDPLFKKDFQKNKNGHLFLSIFKIRPDFFSLIFKRVLNNSMKNM